jgi:hypothetical protein
VSKRAVLRHSRPRGEVEALRRGASSVAARTNVPTASGQNGDGLTGRTPRLFGTCASLSLAAAVLAAAARAIEPFAHGMWLVAYLVLVGFLAQLLLGRCQAMLLATGPPGISSPPIRAQAALWNAGVVAVPLGVLVGARLFVVLGSVALLTSLAAFWQAYRSLSSESGAAPGALGIGYRALILFMAASVLVGTALAWDTPWL